MAQNKTAKLPNGDSYEISEKDQNKVHVYVTERNGQKVDKPYVRTFNHQSYDQVTKSGFITGEVVHDPRSKEQIEASNAPAPEPENSPTAPGVPNSAHGQGGPADTANPDKDGDGSDDTNPVIDEGKKSTTKKNK